MSKAERKKTRYENAHEHWQEARAAYDEQIKRQLEIPLPRSTPWHRISFYFYNRERDSWLCNGDQPLSFDDELLARQGWANVVNQHGPPPDLWELCWFEDDDVVSHSADR